MREIETTKKVFIILLIRELLINLVIIENITTTRIPRTTIKKVKHTSCILDELDINGQINGNIHGR